MVVSVKTVLIPLKSVVYILVTFIFLLTISVYTVIGYPYYANDTVSIDMLEVYNKVRSDTRDGGKSIVKKFSDNGVEGFDCSMFEGDPFPFCISSFYITNSDFEGLDISKFQTIKIYADYKAPT